MELKMNEDLFKRLAAEEEKFFDSEFFSPVLRGQPVRVRIAGVVVNLQVAPKNFQGWGVFRTTDRKTAKLVREPTIAEKREYLDLYPQFQIVVTQRGDRVLGIAANQADSRISVEGQFPILLAEEIELFDTIIARFDGHNFWHDTIKSRRGLRPRIARNLRDLLTEEAEEVSISGLTKEERIAYAIAYQREIESKKDREEERIKSALERGGATYRSYVERGSTYTIEYEVDGRRHRSTVNRDNLEVATAGICLSGQDRRFDLQSLVGVVREGQGTSQIHRMGNNR
jgi:hypothetical protein